MKKTTIQLDKETLERLKMFKQHEKDSYDLTINFLLDDAEEDVLSEEEISEIHKTEPYVYSQMIAGKDAYKPGEAKNSWLTGTAAWNYYAITQYILGIRPEYDGLLVDPCIPANWDRFTVQRKFRNTQYNITVQNPENVSKGIKEIHVDDEKISGNILPVFEDGKIHNVTVVMGK